MKQFVTRVILVIAAAAVFLTGAGVTYMIYCCSGCKTESALTVTEVQACCSQKAVVGASHSCCTSHCDNTSTSNQTDVDECAIHVDEVYCQISHLSADIDLSVFRTQMSNPFIWVSNTYPVLLFRVLSDQANDIGTYALSESPPNIPPREYLSLIRVLVI